MIRTALAAALLLSPVLAQPTFAEETAEPAAQPKYSTADTDIGTLLDNPATRAILEKHLPEVVDSPQIDMARGMTLKGIQMYAPDDITDEKLAAIDAELAQLDTE
ncbi:MAG: hypothetical protein H6918_01025 [Sphingomonadaceae bacterium]|nr:hypothetical protein [Sphingomonadaceae bacterium]